MEGRRPRESADGFVEEGMVWVVGSFRAEQTLDLEHCDLLAVWDATLGIEDATVGV